MFSLDNFNYCSFAYLVFAATSLTVGVVSLAFGSNKTHKLWAIFNFHVAWWGFCLFAISLTKDVGLAKVLWKLAVLGELIAAAFFDFCLQYLNQSNPKFVYLYYFFASLAAGLFAAESLNVDYILIFGSMYYIRSVDWTFSIVTFWFIVPAVHGHILLLLTFPPLLVRS